MGLEKMGLPPKPYEKGKDWTPDAPNCEGCGATFTFFNRKVCSIHLVLQFLLNFSWILKDVALTISSGYEDSCEDSHMSIFGFLSIFQFKLTDNVCGFAEW